MTGKNAAWIDRRRAGILLHISSLPGPFPCGVLGREAVRFVEVLAEAGVTVWQFLPLGPTHSTHSPYESPSSFAGNPRFIDLRKAVSHGWLAEDALPRRGASDAEFARARAKAAAGFWKAARHDVDLAKKVEAFRREHAAWLEDFALFSALKKHFHGRPWWRWPAPLRDRDPEALRTAMHEHERQMHKVVFEQYLFQVQWSRIRQHAEALGVRLFGDMPLYVAHDSADVWTHRDLFALDETGRCLEVAGVPPDYFSARGQRWGHPLYRWDVLESRGFDWWIARVRAHLARMHMLRIDHFRGLEAYWAIPADAPDARQGEWRKAPGASLMEALQRHLGRLPLVAEDLGLITPEVTALRERFGLPGMRVLQFAFDGGPDNPHLPEHIDDNCVVYTGTHDNDTTLGWFQSLDPGTRARVLERTGGAARDMPWPLIRMALHTRALLAVIPMQDVLGLGSQARLNTPGTTRGNWSWRMETLDGLDAAWTRIRRMIREVNR